MRRRPQALALFALAALLPGCSESKPAPTTPPSASAVTLRDGKRRQVYLARPARRIAALSPSSLEILDRLGCGAKVVLRGKQATHPPRLRGLPATSGLQLAAEHIAGFSPDLVLLAHIDPTGLAALTALHIPVAVFEPRTVDRVLVDIEAIGRLCGAPTARRRALVGTLRARIDAVAQRIRGQRRPTVYVELDGADPLKPWTIGSGTFLADLLARAGGRNIFARLSRPYLQVNAEEVLGAAPEVVVLTASAKGGAAALRARPGWNYLPAVRHGRIVSGIDPNLLSRPGPRLVEGLEQLARALHPPATAAPRPAAR